jgi:hypothetical protein
MSLEAGLALCRPFGEEGRVARALTRAVWTLRRTYRPRADGKVNLPKEFAALLARIAAGERVAAPALLPYLCLEERAGRGEVNAQLADAYFQAQTPEHLAQAKIFAQRAWLLTGFSDELLPLYIRILSATGDTAGIRDAYKRAGIEAGRQGRIADALRCFDLWHYAFHTYDKLDRYEYDFDIMSCVDELAAPHHFRHPPPSTPGSGEKIRLAYLVKGALELNSILVKINLELVKHHDRSRFDVTVFLPETRSAILGSPQGAEIVAAFEHCGCRVVTAPDAENPEEVLLGIARKIYESGQHLLVTSAGLASFDHYFITSLRPAPTQIGLVQGPPPQFAPPLLDWCIAWSKHPLMDTPVNCSLVELKLSRPERGGVEAYSRGELGLPERACVLLSGGRHAKFQEPEFWKAMADVLSAHPEAFYVVVGPSDEQVPFLDTVLTPELRSRVRCLGWREDFLKFLGAADILVDTYPNGGGQVLVEAMSAGLAVVAHRNDYMTLFDQTNWSPVEDFISDSDALVPRGDFQRFKEVLARMIEDEEYRRQVAERCRRQVGEGSTEEGVRQCEEIYTRVLGLRAVAARHGAGRQTSAGEGRQTSVGDKA